MLRILASLPAWFSFRVDLVHALEMIREGPNDVVYRVAPVHVSRAQWRAESCVGAGNAEDDSAGVKRTACMGGPPFLGSLRRCALGALLCQTRWSVVRNTC